MNIPDKVKVAGITYKVIKNHPFNGESFSGQAVHTTAEIRLGGQFGGKKYDKQKIEEAFIHEILHCIDSVYNSQGLNEETIDRLSQGIYQTFKDNKIF